MSHPRQGRRIGKWTGTQLIPTTHFPSSRTPPPLPQYSECDIFTEEFKQELTGAYAFRPNAVPDLKKKLGEGMYKWYYRMVTPANINNHTPAVWREGLMESLRNYEIELKTVQPFSLGRANNSTNAVYDSTKREWKNYIRAKYRNYLHYYQTDMQPFLAELVMAVKPGFDGILNNDDFGDIVELIGLGDLYDEEDEGDN